MNIKIKICRRAGVVLLLNDAMSFKMLPLCNVNVNVCNCKNLSRPSIAVISCLGIWMMNNDKLDENGNLKRFPPV